MIILKTLPLQSIVYLSETVSRVYTVVDLCALQICSNFQHVIKKENNLPQLHHRSSPRIQTLWCKPRDGLAQRSLSPS